MISKGKCLNGGFPLFLYFFYTHQYSSLHFLVSPFDISIYSLFLNSVIIFRILVARLYNCYISNYVIGHPNSPSLLQEQSIARPTPIWNFYICCELLFFPFFPLFFSFFFPCLSLWMRLAATLLVVRSWPLDPLLSGSHALHWFPSRLLFQPPLLGERCSLVLC